jgi:outer membrane protein TolC
MQLLWQLENLGLGNRARINERKADQKLTLIELFKVQDSVAAEVAKAHAEVVSASERVKLAEEGLKEAKQSVEGNFAGLRETVRFRDMLSLIIRPQEVLQSIQAFGDSYQNYFQATADYNRAQFRLFRAIGYPSEAVACSPGTGEMMPVDGNRPPQMAPVSNPEPCADCGPGRSAHGKHRKVR